jgi:hypothetical protein
MTTVLAGGGDTDVLLPVAPVAVADRYGGKPLPAAAAAAAAPPPAAPRDSSPTVGSATGASVVRPSSCWPVVVPPSSLRKGRATKPEIPHVPPAFQRECLF